MIKILITKNKDGYSYKYEIFGKDNKMRYVIRNGFESQKSALEAAKRSINYHLSHGYYAEKQSPIDNLKKVISDKKERIDKKISSIELPPLKIKKLNITDAGTKLLTTAVYGTLAITLITGGAKAIKELKECFPDLPQRELTDVLPISEQEINPADCDFSSLHIIIRSAKEETTEVSGIISSQLTQLGVSNEIVGKDSDIIYRLNNAMTNHSDDNIILINLEAGLDNATEPRTVIMSDYSNERQYPADVLVACLNTSLEEYSLNPAVRSGELNANGIRCMSYLERSLCDNYLVDGLTQLTIDIPYEILEDEITRNDTAASILEGILRYTALPKNERYGEIYYTSKFGDTVLSVASDHNINYMIIEENSDIDPHKQIRIGDTLVVGDIPRTAEYRVTVNNPFTTNNEEEIEAILNTYIVQSGDTVNRIADMYGVKPEDVIVPSGNPNYITVGEIVYIRTYNLYLTHEKVDLLREDNNYQM